MHHKVAERKRERPQLPHASQNHGRRVPIDCGFGGRIGAVTRTRMWCCRDDAAAGGPRCAVQLPLANSECRERVDPRADYGYYVSLYDSLRQRITCSLRYFHADGVVALEIHRLFVLGRRRVRYCLYERRMGSDRRLDMVHWNEEAMGRVTMVLRDVIGA
ncbi:uncharacterized protein LOC144166408 [Haemaphysalis longicornis]